MRHENIDLLLEYTLRIFQNKFPNETWEEWGVEPMSHRTEEPWVQRAMVQMSCRTNEACNCNTISFTRSGWRAPIKSSAFTPCTNFFYFFELTDVDYRTCLDFPWGKNEQNLSFALTCITIYISYILHRGLMDNYWMKTLIFPEAKKCRTSFSSVSLHRHHTSSTFCAVVW